MYENVNIFLWNDKFDFYITIRMFLQSRYKFLTEILVCLFLYFGMRLLTWVRLVTHLSFHYRSVY